MRLLPADKDRASDFEDGEWIEKPGFPPVDGTWLHRAPGPLPEFVFEEGHDRTRNEPPLRLVIGTHEDAMIRLDDPAMPPRHCAVFKEGRHWFVELLSPREGVWFGRDRLEQGVPRRLRNGDCFSLGPPPTRLTYRIELDEADNWYLDLNSDTEFPNKWPAKMPGHPTEAPPCPEELKRLAWQTDQMRRKSEEDQVRVADWAAFSQYVKKHYHKYGIFAKPWEGSVGPPVPAPPLPGPRALPPWIADVLAAERMLPHVDRDYPFRKSLELSGREPAPPLAPKAPLPEGPTSSWGTPDAQRFKSGSAGVMVCDGTVHAVARERGMLTVHGGRLAGGTAPAVAATAPAAANPAPRPDAGEGTAGVPDVGTLTTALSSGGPPNTLGADVSLHTPPTGMPSATEADALIVSFRDWLQGMDDAEFVTGYHDALAANFDSLGQVVELYVHAGDLDERFFEVVGIRKLGHRRLFQKWFKDHFERSGLGTMA